VFVIDFESKLKIVLQAQSDVDKEEWIEIMLNYVSKAVTSEENYQTMEQTMKKKKGNDPTIVKLDS
jgi:hypothetical protein